MRELPPITTAQPVGNLALSALTIGGMSGTKKKAEARKIEESTAAPKTLAQLREIHPESTEVEEHSPVDQLPPHIRRLMARPDKLETALNEEEEPNRLAEKGVAMFARMFRK